MLLSSLIFCAASILLLLQFLAVHCSTYALSCSAWASGRLEDWSGAWSCLGWFFGFAILIDWIVFDTFDAWGPSRRALIGATLKLIASAFFCVQPFSDMAGYLNHVAARTDFYPASFGVPWSNFVGILFFHCGNVVDAAGMLPLFDASRPCAGTNLPVVGMWIYMTATWFLAIAGGFAYAETPQPWGPMAANATLPNGQAAHDFIAPGQILGAALLLLGSLLYTAWAACVGRERPAPEPLLNVQPVPGF